MATTIRVNTKSGGAEGAKAALLSYYSLQLSLNSGVPERVLLVLASAFSQPFFCFEGQHPPRQQGVDDLTPAGGTEDADAGSSSSAAHCGEAAVSLEKRTLLSSLLTASAFVSKDPQHSTHTHTHTWRAASSSRSFSEYDATRHRQPQS